jgi:outer membrane protein insertion porin family
LFRIVLFVAALLLPLMAGAQTRPLDLPEDGLPVRAVLIEGTNRVAPLDVENVMEHRAGSKFSRDAYRRDLQSIAGMGKFDPLALRIAWERSDEGLTLRVVLKENPVIKSIAIIGNVRYSETQLKRELGYEVGDLQPTGIRASTTRNLQSFYRNGGFKDARIRTDVETNKEDPTAVDVVINIDERERIRITKLMLNGNTHFTPFLVANRLTNSPGIFFFSNYYDESSLEDDLAVLRALYTNAGFLDASVQRGTPIYNEQKKEIILVYDIVQGPRYRVSGFETEGVTYFTRAEVLREVRKLEGRLFNGNRLAKALDRVQALYGNQGYIDTIVDYRLIKSTVDRTVTIVLEVKESGVAFVGEIRLDMEQYEPEVDINALQKALRWFAPPVKDEAIRREVRLKTGEKFRTMDQVRTEERLRNLGIFRKVEVQPVPTVDPRVKDAVVKVEEDPAAAFLGIAAGVGEDSGPSATVSLTQPNMGGVANRFYAGVTLGTRTTAWRVSYFDRYIGDSDNSLELAIYRNSERWSGYRQKNLGASAEVGEPFSEYLTGYLRVRAEDVQFSSTSDDAIDEDFDDYVVLAARPSVTYDRRDNNRWPTKGYLVSGGLETGVADGFLLKFLHGLEWYHEFDRTDLVYAYRHSVGVMPMDADQVGLGERFFLGGSSTLRGFKARGVGPVDRGDDDLHLGGATRITQSHELRYPFTDFLKGRIFADAGILESGPLELDGPRVGTGVGVILDLGAMQVEVDFGVPVLKESTDKKQFFHLRVGSKF